jgi:hypothetical protein
MRKILAGDGAGLDQKMPDASDILDHVWATHIDPETQTHPYGTRPTNAQRRQAWRWAAQRA